MRRFRSLASCWPTGSRSLAGATLFTCVSLSTGPAVHAKPFMDYIKPMVPVEPLSAATWGEPGVVPRDLSNGIESVKGKGVHPEYYYWDGQIIRAKDGKYHMFMSTFLANTNFGTGWLNSDAYHAVSEGNVLGPYKRLDYVYTNSGSHKGHNVSAVELPDGSYAVIVSETVPFTIYKSNSLDGPWTACQPQSGVGASNVSLVARHDGRFQITERNGGLAISDTLCGNYARVKPKCSYTTANSDTIYPKRTSIPGVTNPKFEWQEDPHIWRSGGVYHVIYSGSGDRVGWHVYSRDGINDWKDNGYAWSPREYKKIFCYEGTTTCNAWYKMERPGVVLQDGHPTHLTWAVSDVDKDNQVLPDTNHGTKVVVIPFDGEAFDNEFGDGNTVAGGGNTATGGAKGTSGTAGTGGSSPQGGTTGTSGARSGSTATGNSSSGAAGRTFGTTVTGGATAIGSSLVAVAASGATGSGGKSGSSSSSSPSPPAGPGGSSATTSAGDHGGTVSSAAGGVSGSGGASSRVVSSASGEPTTGGNSNGASSDRKPLAASNDSASGCDCALGSSSRENALVPSLLLGAIGLLRWRRRNRRECHTRQCALLASPWQGKPLA